MLVGSTRFSGLTSFRQGACHTILATLVPYRGRRGVDFAELMETATGSPPYRYQARIAAEGLPEVLSVPTGAGKTAAAILGWLWRRRFHPDPAVRSATPHWLVFCLPMRVLTEQVADDASRWLESLGLGSGSDALAVHVMMGGRERADEPLRLVPERDAVVVGTMDMLLSRALNRGYGVSRFVWPIDFGLLHNGCHWVFDEVQLMGAALATSRQLEGLRHALGMAVESSSTWMSATVDVDALATIDNPTIQSFVQLDEDDRTPTLALRLDAKKTVRRLEVDPKQPERSIAGEMSRRHRPGTLSIAILNTVRAARAVYEELERLHPDAELVLLHSRFRPPERRTQVARSLASVDQRGPGRIVISTQVIEAGIDVSAALLFTQSAPWPSIVQRAGRCNRDGAADDALVLWAPPTRPEPYLEEDVKAAEVALAGLEGASVSPATLRTTDVAVRKTVQTVLRRRDLLGLFDTAPDLSGNDIDIAPFIRNADDLDALIAWRRLDDAAPTPDMPMPTGEELCPVPVSRELRDTVGRRGWYFDHLAGTWSPLNAARTRPGMVILLDATAGGYTIATGWDPSSKEPVPVHVEPDAISLVEPEEAVGDDPVTFSTAQWVTLRRHLGDVAHAVEELAHRIEPSGLSQAAIDAAVLAGGLHDIGKAHSVFQETMARAADDADRTWVQEGGPWAKSGGARHLRHERPFFRHELASALALLSEGAAALEGVQERDLVVYLVAAHHGRVRLGIRSVPDHERATVLGIADGDSLPEVETPLGVVPRSALSLAPMGIGRSDGSRSWSETMLDLVTRSDLGPFRLGFLEALVRLADWRASARSDGSSR